jgi:peptidyl-prolyl cis-trans isomerase SurA
MHKKKFLIYLSIFFFIYNQSSISIENKILFKINEDIITSIDIENEYRYLIALNKNIRNLNEDEIFEISKKSIIREKIKKIVILNNFKDPKIPDKYLDFLLKRIYQKINIKNKEEFNEYLKINKIDYNNIRKKIETEALWNELIMLKFKSKIQINKEQIKESIINRKKTTTKSYLLSEILFEVSSSDKLSNTYFEIKKTINEKGFDNAALSHSVSNTASIGGDLGWVDESSLNKNLRTILKKTKENDFTKPIPVPGGFLILKIDQIKEIKNELNIEDEVQKMINIKTNNQLNQFSIIYFNKVKKDIKIDEI